MNAIITELEKEVLKKEVPDFRAGDTVSVSVQVKEGDKIRLDKIYFKTGYALLTKESKPVLENIADLMIKEDNLYFTIQGHVCCTQNSRDAVNRKTNQRNLSLARAKFIYDYLIKKGINKRRMRYVGMRRKFPLDGAPEFDRRVEILINYVGEKR